MTQFNGKPSHPNDRDILAFAAGDSPDVRVYEFGVRLDPECHAAADNQIRKARALYNDIVACLRQTYDEMQAWVLSRSGDGGQRAQARVDELNAAFAAAKAANDEVNAISAAW